MPYPFNQLLVLAALVVTAVLWYRGLHARAVATRAARQACRELGLQFLDDTVALAGIGLAKDRGAALEKRYRFEYSDDGVHRYRGRIHCIGRRVVAVQVEDPEGTTILKGASDNTGGTSYGTEEHRSAQGRGERDPQ